MTLRGSFSGSMPLYDGLADEAVAGPAGELGADDELGAEPVGVPGGGPRHRCRERRRVRGERRDGGQQIRPAAVREPGADLAGVAQRAVLVDADEERAEVDRPAGALRPAADDELLLGPDLDLLPAVGALAGDVRRAAVLGHDPLEAADAGRLEERQPAAFDVFAEPDARIRPQDRREQPAALLERLVEQRAAVEVEQVEDLVDERRRLGGQSPCP